MMEPVTFTLSAVWLLAKKSGLTDFLKDQSKTFAEDLLHNLLHKKIEEFFTPEIDKAFEKAFDSIAPKDKQIRKKFLLAFLTDPAVRNAITDMEKGTPPTPLLLHGVLKKLQFSEQEIPALAEKLLEGLFSELSKVPGLADQVTLTLPGYLSRIEKKIDDLPSKIAPVARVAPVNKRPDFFVPELPAHFVGRKGLLTTLRERLVSQPGVVSLTGTHWSDQRDWSDQCDRSDQSEQSDRFETVGIYGMAGVGKTYLALKFAHEQNRLSHFDGIYYQFCGDNSLEVIATELAEKLGLQISDLPPDRLLKILKNHLSQRRALLLLDDVRDSAIAELLPGGRVSTLITTRKKDLPFLAQIPPLDVEEFTEDESLELLQKMLGTKLAGHEEQAKQIAVRLGRLPIAVSVAAGLLRDDVRWTFDRLLALLGQDEQKGIALLEHRDRNIARLFNTAFDRLSDTEERLLCAMAACAEEGFQFELAADIAELTDAKGGPKKLAYAALQMLIDHSLARELNRDEQRYFLHTLIRQTARNRAPFAKRRVRHAEIVITRFENWEKNWQACADILGEAREVMQQSVKNQDIQRADRIVFNSFSLTRRIGRMTEALDFMSAYQHLADALNNKDSLQRSYGNQAVILKAWGRLEEAMQLLKKQEAICIELGDKSGLAYCYWGMAGVHLKKGEKGTAKQRAEQAQALFSEINMPREKKAVEDFLEGL